MEDVSGLPDFGGESEGNEGQDRLSELPKSLILVILSLLPMVDVVRTSVLSKQWNDLWTTIPVLDFGVQKYAGPLINCSNNCSNVFVNRVLKHWKGGKIIKFLIDVNCSCSATYMESWLDFAMDHGVEELSFFYTDSVQYHPVPQRLFSYSTITKLSLSFPGMMITRNVHWNRLKNLEITVCCLADNVIDKILSGAPQLEVLELGVLDEYSNLIIHSSSLKRLRILLYVYLEEEANTSVRIWAPNLQSFHISGAPSCRYLVVNLSSVKDLTFDLQRDRYFYDSSGEAIVEMVRQFFPTILLAEKVSLLDLDCMESLGAVERKYLLSLSSHITFVRVRSLWNGYIGSAAVDKIFSELESIVIQHRSSNLEEQHQVMIKKLECDIEISCSSGDEKLMFVLMEFLLGHASLLQQMVISANPHQKDSGKKS